MLSYRRDAADGDYPTEFYEKYLDPVYGMLNSKDARESASHREALLESRPKYVLMERSYLNGWRTFMQHTEDILPKIELLVERDS